MDFTTLKIKNEIIKALIDMGFTEMMEIQQKVIPYVLENNDIIGQAKTGTGKTAAFGIPLIEKSTTDNEYIEHLIVTPTRELAIQIRDELKKIAKYTKTKIGLIIGGQDYSIERKMLKLVPNIIIGTPGRILDHINNKKLNLCYLKSLTLDEADEMLSFGFKEELNKIIESMPVNRQSMLFSATMPKEVQNLANKMLNNPINIFISSGLETTENVEQFAIITEEKAKFKVLTKLIETSNPKKAIIFGRTKRRVDELSLALTKVGFKARAIHGDLTQNERTSVMTSFRKGQFNILVATDVAARGLDIEGIDTVYNYDLPQEIEYYVHRIGRTGRALQKGKSYTLVGKQEVVHLDLIMKKTSSKITYITEPTLKQVKEAKLDQVIRLLTSTMKNEDTLKQFDNANNLIEKYGAVCLVAAALELLMPKVNIKDIKLTPEPIVNVKLAKKEIKKEQTKENSKNSKKARLKRLKENNIETLNKRKKQKPTQPKYVDIKF